MYICINKNVFYWIFKKNIKSSANFPKLSEYNIAANNNCQLIF